MNRVALMLLWISWKQFSNEIESGSVSKQTDKIF